ncbi:hypothetical protein [Streptomyces sp. NPDC051921]|uniref:hypothetical protein n=1 Tax=Streptomyces sp. NPDC051921 TaxID=3155806 RepID=UPI003414E4F6
MKEVPEKKPAGRTPAAAPTPAPSPSPADGLSPHSVQRLQGAAGNAAVARLVAQRYTAPVKTPASAAPGFRRVGADVAAKKRTMAAHAPAATESKSAQDAAVAPPDDKEAQGKAANAEKMNAAKPGEFDKAAFIAAVDKAIEAQAPKNLDEADKFSKSGKADKVKDEVDGKVTDGKNTSAKDIETTTKAPPDTSAAKDKQVTPLTPDRPPANPGAPSAADAIPEKQPAAVTDFSEGPAQNDKALADAEVTEEQLAKGNEPEFNDALKAKKSAEADSAKAPGKAHAAEDQQLATAKAGAAAAGAQAMNALTATRAAAGRAVDGGKGETKSKDETKRAEVTAKLQKVFDATKKDVEATLTGLDTKVDTAFTSGEKQARDAFTADHKARMKKYKDKRYGGFLGKGRWLKDKFAGMPKEANDLYQESRKLYVARMRTVISSVADMIGVELGRAKSRIAQGRADLKAEVDRLPADLKAFGEEAAKDFAGKFEDLEASVNEKSEQLVQDLANKYTAALNAVDEEIKKLQEANKGLIDKAKDAIVGAIKTIKELTNLLLGILAKAASAVMKIIKDPIGFLGNLVRAVGAGLNLFVSNIGEHLKKGLVSWLLGTAVKAGLDLPQRFDLRGIITLIASLLGLTWDNIRARITRKGVPDEAMSAVESSVPVAQSLAREGPAGAVKEIEAEAGDLKSTILSKLTEYLVPTVIIAGITWIVSLLNPASAFVRAVKGIIDIVTFVVNQGAQIADFVNAVLDAVIEIANGGAAGVPKMVEGALAASIPLLIGFLASLLGIGNLANKVKSVFQAVSRPVNRAIDKVVDFIAKKGKALWQKLKGDKTPKGDAPAKNSTVGSGPKASDRSPASSRGSEGRAKEARLEKALTALRPRIESALKSGPSGISFRAKLAAWRVRHRLTSLSVERAGDSFSVIAKINPQGVAASGFSPSGNDLRKLIHRVAKSLLSDPQVRAIADAMAERKGEDPKGTLHVPPREGIPGAVAYFHDMGGDIPHYWQEYKFGDSREGVLIAEGNMAGVKNFRASGASGPVSEAQARNWITNGPRKEKEGAPPSHPEWNDWERGESYPKIAEAIAELNKNNMTDRQIASAVRSFIREGRAPKDNGHLIGRLSWLMSVRESHRNTGNLAFAPMTIDLVAAGEMSWGEALNRYRAKGPEERLGERGEFPMSMVGAQAAAASQEEANLEIPDAPHPSTVGQDKGKAMTHTKEQYKSILIQRELADREIALAERWVRAKIEAGELLLGADEAAVEKRIRELLRSFYTEEDVA